MAEEPGDCNCAEDYTCRDHKAGRVLSFKHIEVQLNGEPFYNTLSVVYSTPPEKQTKYWRRRALWW